MTDTKEDNMDAEIADAINRHDAHLIALDLDAISHALRAVASAPWYRVLNDLAGDSVTERAKDMACVAAAGVQGIHFDGEPADGDWENFLGHLRAEIQTRRDCDPEIPCAAAPTAVASGVGS